MTISLLPKSQTHPQLQQTSKNFPTQNRKNPPANFSNPKSQIASAKWVLIHWTQWQQRQTSRATSSSDKASTTSKVLTQRCPKRHCQRRGQYPITHPLHNPATQTHPQQTILATHDRSMIWVFQCIHQSVKWV